MHYAPESISLCKQIIYILETNNLEFSSLGTSRWVALFNIYVGCEPKQKKIAANFFHYLIWDF